MTFDISVRYRAITNDAGPTVRIYIYCIFLYLLTAYANKFGSDIRCVCPFLRFGYQHLSDTMFGG